MKRGVDPIAASVLRTSGHGWASPHRDKSVVAFVRPRPSSFALWWTSSSNGTYGFPRKSRWFAACHRVPRSSSPAADRQSGSVSRRAVRRSKPTASYRGMRLGYAAMARFIVEGGPPLRGEITAKGNKTSALPPIAASLLTNEPVILRNLPRIRDVAGMLEILSGLGATVEWLDASSAKICAANVNKTTIDPKLSREIRGSLLCAGPVLARFKKVTLGPPGGDVIGRRRSDTHWLALERFGAKLMHDRTGFGLEAPALAGADVLLDEQSVTATENALLCSVLAPGRSVIRNAASEPHVQELSMVLVQMGARIHGIGTNTLEVRG